MDFIIFGDSFTFPDGNAATNRVFTYAKGFVGNGIDVHVVCSRNDYLDEHIGVTDGIKYYHPYGQTTRNRSFLIRRWLKLKKYIRIIKLVRDINHADSVKAIIVYSETFLTQLFGFFLARAVKSKLIVERSEHPLRNFNHSISKRIIGDMRIVLERSIYDGMFCISNYLVEFYANRGFYRQKILQVPSTVDTERFNGHYDPPLNYKYIAYCGSLTVLKDGVDILIMSFANLYREYPDIYLVLIGGADTLEEEIELKELVKSSNIESRRVIFLGKLPRTAIPAYLCNAEILALARPRSIVADAGFPSKLTEYLATGKPVVVTKVGEIPDYLKDNENAFLSEPGSVDAFTERLDFVLKNYQTAKEVGANGRELTSTVFNYRFQAKRIINFIGTL